MSIDPSLLVGERVRVARLARGWTVRDLAERGGIAFNTVSLIERGKASPTVSTLSKLANALGVSMASLVEEASARPVSFLPQSRRVPVQGLRVQLENLAAGLAGCGLEALLLTLEPDADSGPDAIVHLGHELIFCLEGSLEYVVDEEPYAMAKGDSLLFEARLPHRWRNTSEGVTRLLLIIQTENVRPPVAPPPGT